ncbi:MAG: T9SS C-terminal target domain-containing protein [Ignavibacteriales bacterium]|nr:MAG: T9SS C-terminal target domain-containing protein [Ignavibacteriales bacterium]
MYLTTNAGIDWTKENKIHLGGGPKAIRFINPNTGWLVGDNGMILKTTDGGAVFVEENPHPILPESFYLYQNYPNPFNPSTRIQYQVSSISQVTLKVFDVLGNEIANLVDEEKPAGVYNVEFGIKNAELSSGIYFYQLKAGNYLETKKMVYLK